jgi:hypothetical protein
MLLFFFIILSVLSDNIEMNKEDFEGIEINDEIISSSSLSMNESVKISYPGVYVYKLKEVKDKHFKLVDDTVYFTNERDDVLHVRIEIEEKICGMTNGSWKIAIFLLSMLGMLYAIYSWALGTVVLNKEKES